jgi:5,10-methylenetetrahydrofolate reductase
MMGPAEIVASLKELCESRGPRVTTGDIVAWIDQQGGYESESELIAFAKKMKARQYARMLAYEDEDSGVRVKRLWSIRDRETGRRSYADLLDMPPERRHRLIKEYAKLLEQQRAIRRAMADFFAGQQFFDFYNEHEPESVEVRPN